MAKLHCCWFLPGSWTDLNLIVHFNINLITSACPWNRLSIFVAEERWWRSPRSCRYSKWSSHLWLWQFSLLQGVLTFNMQFNFWNKWLLHSWMINLRGNLRFSWRFLLTAEAGGLVAVTIRIRLWTSPFLLSKKNLKILLHCFWYKYGRIDNFFNPMVSLCPALLVSYWRRQFSFPLLSAFHIPLCFGDKRMNISITLGGEITRTGGEL